MSGIEPLDCGAAMRALREEIHRLSEQQIAAQKKAALTGMTPDEAQEYKLRHCRIRKLTEDLAVLAESK